MASPLNRQTTSPDVPQHSPLTTYPVLSSYFMQYVESFKKINPLDLQKPMADIAAAFSLCLIVPKQEKGINLQCSSFITNMSRTSNMTALFWTARAVINAASDSSVFPQQTLEENWTASTAIRWNELVNDSFPGFRTQFTDDFILFCNSSNEKGDPAPSSIGSESVFGTPPTSSSHMGSAHTCMGRNSVFGTPPTSSSATFEEPEGRLEQLAKRRDSLYSISELPTIDGDSRTASLKQIQERSKGDIENQASNWAQFCSQLAEQLSKKS